MSDRAAARRLVLVRHGRTVWNSEDRAQGHVDIGLDEVGERQAAAMAPYVAATRPVALWSSDLVRARQTAAHLERVTGLGVREDPRLRELDVGDRAGLTAAEFADRFPREYEAWQSGRLSASSVPGAESVAQLAARSTAVLRELLAATGPDETTVVVGHGTCLRVALIALLEWPEAVFRSLRELDNCAWAVVEQRPERGSLRLVSYNQSAHPTVHAPDFVSEAPVR